MATSYYRGTNGNNTVRYVGIENAEFQDIGFGQDRVTGGPNGDVFNMVVDRAIDRIDGGAGVDLINYHASAYQLNIDLSTGLVRANFGTSRAPDWQTATEVQNIENAVGSYNDDTMIGSDTANYLNGAEGNDIIHAGAGDDTLVGGIGGNQLDGGTGTDTVDYSTSHYMISANLSQGYGFDWDPANWLIRTFDTYTSIENLVGSRYDDRLDGNAGSNVIDGGAGNDVINGQGGNDTLRGGDGDDRIAGGDGDDLIYGGAGNDVLSGGFGTNHFDGGDGIDTADYSQEAHSVFAGLGTGWPNHGTIGDFDGATFSHDTFTSIENLTGGNSADFLVGNERDNVLNGNGGNDILAGDRGDDTINGGDGNDTISGDAGADRLDGGNGINWLSYSHSTAAVMINLATSTASFGDATGDMISNFQNVIGSAYNDVLIGSNADNILLGAGGNDRLTGGGGHDTFAFLSGVKGTTVITDFHIGEDTLAFEGPRQGMHAQQVGANTVLTFDHDPAAIILQNVNTTEFLQHLPNEIAYSQSYDGLY